MTEASDAAHSTVVVARHGLTDWNAERRFQGWAAVGLNDRGRGQARALGRHLADTYDFDRVVASDLRRTRETAALVREAGVEPEPAFRATWRERDLGIYQGLPYEAVNGDHPEFDPSSGLLGLESRPQGGESLLDLHRRVREGWRNLRASLDGDTVLVVTHGGPLHVVHGLVTGEDLLTAFQQHSHTNCACATFHVDDRTVALQCSNETAWELPAADQSVG